VLDDAALQPEETPVLQNEDRLLCDLRPKGGSLFGAGVSPGAAERVEGRPGPAFRGLPEAGLDHGRMGADLAGQDAGVQGGRVLAQAAEGGFRRSACRGFGTLYNTFVVIQGFRTSRWANVRPILRLGCLRQFGSSLRREVTNAFVTSLLPRTPVFTLRC
jgi:hypothetical protein